jgi:hypothetical protein
LTSQDFEQRRALVAQRWSVLTRVVFEIDEHVGSSGRGHGRIIVDGFAAAKRLTTPAPEPALAELWHDARWLRIADVQPALVEDGFVEVRRRRPSDGLPDRASSLIMGSGLDVVTGTGARRRY